MWKVLLVLLPLALPSVKAYDDPTHAQLCVESCMDALGEITFGTTVETDDYYTGYCEDTLRWSSAYVCTERYCSPQEIKTGLSYLQLACDEVNLPIPSYDDILANFTDEDLKALRVIEFQEVPADEIVNNTLVPSPVLFHRSYRSWEDWIVVNKAHYDYGWAMYGFWGIVLLTGIVNRLFAGVVHWRLRRTPQDSEADLNRRKLAKPHFSGIRRWIQRHITLPAVFGYRHQQPLMWCTVPTRIQSFLVFAYVAINLILCAVTYRGYKENIFWDTVGKQTWTYLADRTGILALANMPLLWIFASRNDILLWLTGWNFGTFNVFHRWIARIVTLEVIVHSAAYTLIYRQYGAETLAEAWHEQFWYCGVMATIAFSFLWLFSFYPIREKLYELFYKLHVALAVFALVGTFYHIKIYEGEWEPYLWPCVAIWVFDHFVRLLRLIVLNYKVAFGGHTKALIKYNAERDILRIHYTPSYHNRPKPGTHYFVYFPTMLKSFGNHPFSLASWTVSGRGNLSSPVGIRTTFADPEKVQSYPPVRTTEAEVGSESENSQTAASTAATELRFIVRPYKGLTAHLRDAVIKTGTGTKEIPILVEGPYGHPHPLLTYDNVLFIVGGSGIAAVLPYIQEFMHPENPQAIRTKHIHLVWAARQYTFVRDVIDNELAAAASISAHHRVKMDFFITGSAPKSVKADALDLDRLEDADTRISYKRPVSENLVIEEASEAVGSLAVFVCGPRQMADDTRRAAVHVVGNGFARLGYFEEQFGW